MAASLEVASDPMSRCTSYFVIFFSFIILVYYLVGKKSIKIVYESSSFVSMFYSKRLPFYWVSDLTYEDFT